MNDFMQLVTYSSPSFQLGELRLIQDLILLITHNLNIKIEYTEKGEGKER